MLSNKSIANAASIIKAYTLVIEWNVTRVGFIGTVCNI